MPTDISNLYSFSEDVLVRCHDDLRQPSDRGRKDRLRRVGVFAGNVGLEAHGYSEEPKRVRRASRDMGYVPEDNSAPDCLS